MKPRYIVTKGSDDKTFLVGDHIIFNSDGSISCIEAEGWVDVEDVDEALKGIEYEVDPEYVRAQKEYLLTKMGELTELEESIKK